MIAYKDSTCFRIQAKYSSTGLVSYKNAWNDKKGTHVRKYKDNDFDYYAIYLPSIDKVVYPSIKFGGIQMATRVPNSAAPFWWWEDFLDFTDDATKKNYKYFGANIKITHTITDAVIKYGCEAARSCAHPKMNLSN